MNRLTEINTQPRRPFGSEPPSSPGGTNSPGSAAPTSEIMPSAAAGGADPDDILRLKAENEQLKATIRDAAAHRQITGELGHIGARSPELLFAAVKGELQFADDGAIVNPAALIDRIRRTYPEQFGADRVASIDAGVGIASPPRLTRDALAKMTPAEIAKLDWEDVKRTLAQG